MLQLTHHQHSYLLRPMKDTDVDTVLVIEQSAPIAAWNISDFQASLNCSHDCMVLENHQHLVAYAITSTAADEAELLKIAVTQQYQRQGIGRLLLNAMIKRLDTRIQMVFLEVAESNHKAISLYHDCHFNSVGMRPRYYPSSTSSRHGGRENAIIMAKSLHP